MDETRNNSTSLTTFNVISDVQAPHGELPQVEASRKNAEEKTLDEIENVSDTFEACPIPSNDSICETNSQSEPSDFSSHGNTDVTVSDQMAHRDDINSTHNNIHNKETNLAYPSELKSECAGSEKYHSTKSEVFQPLSTVQDSSHLSSNDSSLCSDTPQDNLLTCIKKYEYEADSLSEFDSDGEYCNIGVSSAAFITQSKSLSKKHGRKKSSSNRLEPAEKFYEMQLELFENSNKKLQNELVIIKSRIPALEDEFKSKEMQLKAEFEFKIDKLSRECETLKKEKETMVIRYANSEKEVIFCKKTQNELEKKIKELNRDRENIAMKVKVLQMEKKSVSSNLDQKIAELASLQREQEKIKEDVSCKDIKIKWVQNKLKTEMDAHKETQNKLEHTIQRLHETREEAEQIRKDCQEMVRRYQEAEEIKSVKLDHQLKQKLTELEVQKQERSDQEEVYQMLKQELEALKKKQRITLEENNSLTLKIQSLEKERLDYEQTSSKLKDTQNSLKQEVVDLIAHLAEMENLKLLLEREKEKFAASVREVDRLRQTNAELQSDMDACHMKEGELLEFTEKLTAKTVQLQSEHTGLESKTQALEEEVVQLTKRYSELELKNVELITSLEEEKESRNAETQLLARKLAEKTKMVEHLNVNLEEQENENQVTKRRYRTTMKELLRELQQCRKKLELLETYTSAPADAASLGSRASSSASLDTINIACQAPSASLPVSSHVAPSVTFSGGKTSNLNHDAPQGAVVVAEVDKQMLIERIVKLQKFLAAKNDKIEFLEDTLNQLLKEVKKKSRIIQNYILQSETGALVPSSFDEAKIDLTKKGGIMASVYSSHSADENMTLELSLEINSKLQAVLEDTLLKNITLKDNMRTLGEDIAQLTADKRELTRQLLKSKNK